MAMNGHYGGGGGGGYEYARRPHPGQSYQNGYHPPRYRERRDQGHREDSRTRAPAEDPYRRGEDPYRRHDDLYRKEDPYSTRLPNGAREDPYSRRLPTSQQRQANGHGGRPEVKEPVFELDHLATFTVGQKQGMVSPQHGIDRLKHMEMTTGIWTMRCKLIVDSRDLVIVDKQTSDEMERFPLDLVVEPTARMSKSNSDSYDNVVLFTVLGDRKRGMENSEMHIFQCIGRPAEEVVDEILQAKKGAGHSPRRETSPQRPPAEPRPMPPSYDKVAAERAAQAAVDYKAGPPPGQAFRKAMAQDDNASDMSDRTDRDVQILNHCFDDIEKFAVRLQNAADAFMELERRIQRRDKKPKQKHMGDGMLTMRARPPPAKDFIDVFQKFKLSFNVLARLKHHIHDPNAPELVHFIFTPLSLACDASRDPQRGTPELASKVVSPLLTQEAKDLLENCLSSKEMELWRSLGDSWTISRDNWRGYVPPYYPRFSNGWQPSPSFLDDLAVYGSQGGFNDRARYDLDKERENRERELRELREQEQRERDREEDPYRRLPDRREQVPRDYPQGTRSRSDHDDRYDRGRSPQRRDLDRHDSRARSPGHMSPARPASPGVRGGHNDVTDFYRELREKGVMACEVLHDRGGNNDRELDVRRGEILEVVDKQRNWWKLRNQRGEMGHAPFNILRLLPSAGVR